MPPKRGRPAVKAIEESNGQTEVEPRKGRSRAEKTKEESPVREEVEVQPKKTAARKDLKKKEENGNSEKVEKKSKKGKKDEDLKVADSENSDKKTKKNKKEVEEKPAEEAEEKSTKTRGRKKKEETDEVEKHSKKIEEPKKEEKSTRGRKKKVEQEVEKVEEPKSVSKQTEDVEKEVEKEEETKVSEEKKADEEVEKEEGKKSSRGRKKKKIEDEPESVEKVTEEKKNTEDVEMEAADGDDEKAKDKPEKKADKEVSKTKSTRSKRKNDSPDVEEQAAKKSKPPANKTETNLDEIDFGCDKENAEGKTANIKICSWNVSGVRALLKKNGFDYIIKEDADIIALQETKCDLVKLPGEINIPGYKHKYLESTSRSGYSGIAVYSKEEFISVTEGINDPELDKEGRMLTIEYPNFYFINVYVPNAGDKLKTMDKRMKFNELFLKRVKELDSKKPVIICGDLNVAHKEIDLKNPKTNTKHAGFTPEERQGMTDLLDSGFVDVFRHFYPDKIDAYTFWSNLGRARENNTGWRLDYYIVSDRIKNNVCDTVIRDKVYGSDHCPIILFANL